MKSASLVTVDGAFAGTPDEVGTSAMLALLLAFYVAGHLIQPLLRAPFADKLLGAPSEPRTCSPESPRADQRDLAWVRSVTGHVCRRA